MIKHIFLLRGFYVSVLSGCLVVTTSCVTPIQIQQDSVHYPSLTEKQREQAVASFFWGFVNPSKPVRAYQACPHWRRFTISRSFSQVMLSLVTLGVYIPFYVTFVCPISPPLKELSLGD